MQKEEKGNEGKEREADPAIRFFHVQAEELKWLLVWIFDILFEVCCLKGGF